MGFIINNNIEDKIIKYIKRFFSERIKIIIKFNFKNAKILSLVQIYAPTVESEEKEFEDFYDLLNNVIEKIKKNQTNFWRF